MQVALQHQAVVAHHVAVVAGEDHDRVLGCATAFDRPENAPDGVVDEAAWDAIQPLTLVMHSPTYLGEMTEETEIRVAYDDQYVYVAGRMRDSDPAGIRANTFNRDSFSGDDQLAVLLDSYNDFETAVMQALVDDATH